MKWKLSGYEYPSAGDKYERTFFAWLPTRTETHWVWLEPVIETGVWETMYDMSCGCGWVERRKETRRVVWP